jgi:hypothetical protein
VLEHQAQAREALHEGSERLLDEDALAVEHVDLRVGRLAVHEQRQVVLLHRLEHGPYALQPRHAGVGIRGRARRVVLEPVDEAAGFRAPDLVAPGGVGEIERHERLERGALRQGGEDALPVGARLRRGRDRRPQVRHDDGAGELPRGVREHARHGRAVAQVQVPVVRARDRQRVHVN